ncbi:hypothetical protein B5S29_g3373 [[Candida] boidinii]|nr:hypothetical protein B5S29_g3373 [[Candida] boidinii]
MSKVPKAQLVVLESWSDSSLAKLPHDDLLSLKSYLISNKYQHFVEDDNQIFLLDSVFPQIFNSLKNSEGLSDYRVIACDCLSIWILRSNQIISNKSASSAIEYNYLLSNLLDEETLTFLYQYVIDFWSDAGSSLSNALKDMFSKLLILINNLNFNNKENFKNNLIKNWLINIFNNLSYTTRVYYFMVENLSKNLLDEPDFVLNYNKNFLTNSIKIMYSSTLANISSKAIQTVLKNLYSSRYEKTSKDLEWLNIWCNTVIENLYDDNLKKNISIYLLPYLFKISKTSTIKFISIIKENVNNNSNKIGNEDEKDISLLLECLKIAQELAIIVEPFDIDQNIEPIISIKDLKLLLINENPFFRISSLSLLTFSPKNSKIIKPYIFNIIYEFLPILFIENDIEIRNILFSILKNFIIRIRDSSYSINRELINLNKKLNKKNLNDNELLLIDNLKISLNDYQKFLIKLIDLVHLNLLPGLSYQKISFALKLLNCIIKSGLDNRINKKHLEKNHIDYPFNIEIYNKDLFRLLLDNISDEFNDIRQTSTEILNMSPVSISEIFKEVDDINNNNVNSELNELDLYFNRSELMIKDIKGRKGDSGARFFQLLFQNYQSNNEISKCLDILNTLTSNLKNSIDYLESNLVFAIYKENIHGYYSSLRFIFEIIEFDKFINYSAIANDTLLNLVNNWIELIIKNWELTKFFLQNDSPEGFDNLKIEPSEADEIKKLIENYGPITQILSSYSWRSMKESSSLLKEIFDKSPSNYFKIDQVSSIGGEILIEQLSTIRHRGAFSSVYPTFISCCIRCKTYGKSDIVKQWLDDCIDNILKLKYNQYITRRSAGIPFLITAILTSEVEYNKKTKKFSLDLIEYTIDKLLNISKLTIDSIESGDIKNDSTQKNEVVVKLDKIDLPQVNAINCIRSIFIESSLSDVSIFFIDKVLDLCLNQFDSPIWSIRNCSVMLFSALQNKLFGCKKRKKMNLNSEDSVKSLTIYSITNIETLNNLPTVSSRLFFSKFKDIKEILFKNLKGSIQDTNKDNENIERIFPILTVLSRLEATNNYTGLVEFKPLIFKCLENKIYKVREMASKSLPCIITDDEILLTCSELIEQAVTTRDMNKCHGYIFAIKELILRSISRKDEIDSTENNLSSELINKIYSYFGEFINNDINPKYPIILLYLQIVAILNDYKQVDNKVIDQLGNWFINENLTSFELNGAKQLSLSISCDILLNTYINRRDNNNNSTTTTIEFIEFAINSDYFEVVLKLIEICNLKIEYLSNDIVKLLIEYLWKIILNENEWSFTKSRSLDLLKNLLLMNNNTLDITHQSEEEDNDHFTKKILVLTKLIEESDNEDIKCNCLETLSPFIYYYLVKLEFNDNKFGFFDKWIKNVEKFNNDDNSFNFRKSSIKSLILMLNLMLENKEFKFNSSEYYGSCIFQLFSFLFDDDENLRNMSSIFISKKLMNLKFSVLPISVIKNFNNFIQDQFNTELLTKLINNYNLFNEINKNYENFSKLFIEDYLLFTIEKQNLYKNQIELNNIKNSLLLSLSKKDKTSNKLIMRSINSDRIQSTLISIYDTVKTQDIDGAFGWTDDEDIFNTISCCLSDCATYDEITKEKNFVEVANKLNTEFKAKKVHYILLRQLEELL